MSEDWNSLVKDLVVSVCVIFIIASALAGATSYGIYTYNKAIDYAVENDYEFYYNGTHVDKDKLNIDNYAVTINNEKNEVYLSDKIYHVKGRYSPVKYSIYMSNRVYT